MSIEGRINIDVLFHDKDGTASLKVVSLQDSKEYTTGKVAVVSGTVGTTAVTFSTSDGDTPASTYRDASGQLVAFSSFSKVVIKATTQNRPLVLTDQDSGNAISVPAEEVLVYPCGISPTDGVTVRSVSATAAYTIILYGESYT
jgi:hypothetical protein